MTAIGFSGHSDETQTKHTLRSQAAEGTIHAGEGTQEETKTQVRHDAEDSLETLPR